MSDKVLVTGATGYIALHVVEALLKEGRNVRGTVRSITGEKSRQLTELFPSLELVAADLTKDDGWVDAVKGCKSVVHVASPFPGTPPRNEMDVIRPAVDGTLRVLKACLASKTVRRVVLTSSIVSVHGETTVEEGRVYTEDDWSDDNSRALDAYGRSKTRAERAAWEFVKQHPELELAVINPGLVLGPAHRAFAVGTSLMLVKRLLDGTMPLYPRVNICICDVRDVALAHVRALTNPAAVGNRHIIASDHMWIRDMAAILKAELGPLGYSPPRCAAPTSMIWLISWVDGNSRILLPRLGGARDKPVVTMSDKVLVTGATGYLALHVVEALLKEGRNVRGTVRSITSDKSRQLTELFPSLELVEADLNKDDGWVDAVKGCKSVVHVASPFPATQPRDEMDLIRPAVDGTLRVLNACLESGTVRRVVLTSSGLAVHGESTLEEGRVYTEDDWSDDTSKALDAYARSKTLAERAAWEFVKEHPELELAVINPGLIIGPVHRAFAVGSSLMLVKRLLDGSIPLYPRVNICICDVRDVALAHVRALTNPAAVGHRHIIVSDHIWVRDVADILRTELGPLGYSPPHCAAPTSMVWLISWVDDNARFLLPRLGKAYLYANERMKNVLEITPINTAESIKDTAHSLIRLGVLKKTAGYTANYWRPTKNQVGGARLCARSVVTMSDKVLVTGATGYIALHVVEALVKEGRNVRGTVRSITSDKSCQLTELFPSLELVAADLIKDDGWVDAVKGCKSVIHVASPFPGTPPRNEMDVIRPAVDGTLRVLKACQESGTVRRVVLTSSIVSIHGETTVEEGRVYTEKDWSDDNSRYLNAYDRSKTRAERAAWEFVKEHPELELVVINPGLVLGPTHRAFAVGTSLILVKRLLDGTMPLYPRVNICICDVRDVALAHVRALTNPAAVGNRHIIASDHMWIGEMAAILKAELGPLGYSPPRYAALTSMIWLISWVDGNSRILLPRLGGARNRPLAAMSDKVLVTGATGYIALHVVEALLKEGRNVRGTVRSITGDKSRQLTELFPSLELVAADLTKDDGWVDAVKGCQSVIHVASPFPATQPRDEMEVIRPAVDGTLRVLKACLESGTVRRVVLTSSVVSVHGETTVEEGRVYTEEDWSDDTSKALDAYGRSKTRAERAAWEFVKEHPELELAVINPGLVLGPSHLAFAVGSSLMLVKRLLDGSMPLYPRVNICICDVRDVALAHVRALTNPAAVGHRHIIASDHMWVRDMAEILKEELGPLDYSPPKCAAPTGIIWLISWMDGNSRILLPRLGKVYLYANERMKNVLGITPIEPADTLKDTAHSLIRLGVLKKTPSYMA
ncbi:hypothetical protein LAZ67_16000386, partial [Cordylochernes scorpioides]